jgi:hypothetical protein
MDVKSSGVCRTTPHAGGMGVAFKDTDGGKLRYTYEREDKGDLTLPPIDGAFRTAGKDKAQYWQASYDGAYTGEIEMTFSYDGELLDPDEDERLVTVWHHDGSQWEELVPLGHSPAADYVTVTATGFSPFVLGYLTRLPGDGDEDGDVDAFDYIRLKRNFGLVRADWPDGDFNGDGKVNRLDVLALRHFFGARLPDGGKPVPEPAAGLLLLLGAAAGLRRRRGRRP